MRIGIVDGFSTARFLVEELRRRGASCIHIRSQKNPPKVYARAFKAAAYTYDLGWSSAVLQETATKLAELSVDRVVAGTESGVVLADQLNHLLELPGNRIALAHARRVKAAMARALRAAGLATAEDISAATPQEAVAWFTSRSERPVVVKPQSSAGTDNVRICRTATEVAAACQAVLDEPNFFGEPNRTALVQEYLDGEEYYVNTVSLGGVHKVAEIWRSVRRTGPDGAPLYDYQEPVPVDDPVAVAAAPYIKDVLTALGIANGAAHSELRVTERGPVLLETGARLGGGVLPRISRDYAGVSHVHLLADSLTDPDAFDAFDDTAVTWSKNIRYVSLISHHPGTAAAATWQDTMRSLTTFDGLISRISAGGAVPRTIDLASSPGVVYLVADSAGPVEDDYAHIRTLERDKGLYLS
ncbi:ATP-grasp domain-containing protein [Streptomyces sp. RB6PN25]|uniref:ATP-grasp domain-containing protein n=1 Tax=Streptomyces humicola TaxID=2953240 RepID=A0ABT1PPM0_9ACTN|nr:ATP-grasp domain-containing protein [Streptomyces humicola]MCQ4079624.1 ATP-grasp domain-containing protein [Streptomyces humicola]